MIRKSQASLETTIAFLVVVSLFFGIMGIWIWGDRQIAKRQPPFNDSRVQAGTVERKEPGGEANKKVIWPTYTKETLNKNEVHF